MEPLSAFSSLSATTQLSTTVISQCIRYSKKVKNARAEIERLQREVTSLQEVLGRVEKLYTGPNSAKLEDTRSFDAIDDAKRLLQQLEEGLSRGETRKPMKRLGFRAIKWPFQSEDVEEVISDLRNCIDIISKNLQIDDSNILRNIGHTQTVSMGLQVEQMNILSGLDQKVSNLDQKAVFDKLDIASGAFFDSFDEGEKAKCLTNTRVDLLSDISKWANDPDSHAVFWLNGMAGTGKSTIARTVAQSLEETSQLGASFFFKRGERDRGSLHKFFTTIAADLARRQPATAPPIKKAIDADPGISQKAAREQFEKLVLDPMTKISRDSGIKSPIIVIIDALDECDRDDEVKLLIHLFSHYRHLKYPRLKAFLTSRPELPPRVGFGKISGEYQDLILHDVSPPVIEKDIFNFFEHKLADVRNEFNTSVSAYQMLPGDWPGEHNVKTLVKMATPLFIFASTTCRFLADRKCGNPRRQLERVLAYKTRSQQSKLDATYLPVLEQQLIDLCSEELDRVVEEFRTIVGSIVILASPLSIVALSKLLNVSQDTIADRLDMLHSVLSVPAQAERPVRLLHLSFRDFLLDPNKREKEWWVDEKRAHKEMADHCLRVLNGLKPDLCDIKAPGTPRSDIDREKIDAVLPPELQYACLYWVNYVEQSGIKLADGDQVHQFLLSHFLHWLEALSLIGRSRESIGLVRSLFSLLEPQSSTELSNFLDDANRFMLANISLIESWPLQIYSSALIFAPKESVVRIKFKDSIPSWISSLPEVDYKWSPCLQVLEGHTNTVGSVAFSHDSTLVASASEDKTVRIWLVDTGECLQELKGHSEEVNSVSFSHDSSLIVSASHDRTIRVWRTDTGDCVQILEGHTNWAWSAAFSHDSALIVSSSRDKTVRIWDGNTGKCALKLLGHSEKVYSVAFSHDSTLVASASEDNTVRIWNAANGTCIHSLKHRKSVFSVAFSHDSTLVVSGGSDNVIRIWRVDTGKCERELRGHNTGSITSVTFSHNSTFIASASLDKTVRVWRTDTGDCVQIFNSHTHHVGSVAFSHDSKRIASASHDHTVRIWDATTLEDHKTLDVQRTDAGRHTGRVHSVIFSHDSTLIASVAQDDPNIRIWHAHTGRCIRKLDHGDTRVDSLVFSRDSALLASASDATCRVWKVDAGTCIDKLHVGYRKESTFSRDLKLFALSSKDTTVQIWHTETGDCIHSLAGHTDSIQCLAFSHNSQLLASGSWDKTVRVWSVETGHCIHQLKDHSSFITSIAFSDSTLVASVSDDKTTCIWRIDTGDRVQRLRHKNSWIRAMAFSHDASLIASQWNSKVVGIWRTETGELVQKINLGIQWSHLEFEPDKPRLLTDVGSFDININPRHDVSATHRYGYSISSDRRWIMWGEENLLWLPQEYEDFTRLAARGSTISLGFGSGRVAIIGFSTEKLPCF